MSPGYFEKPLKYGLPYSTIFNEGECICNQNRMGKRCEKVADFKAIMNQSEKNKKLMVWSTMMVNDYRIKLYEFRTSGHTDIIK